MEIRCNVRYAVHPNFNAERKGKRLSKSYTCLNHTEMKKLLKLIALGILSTVFIVAFGFFAESYQIDRAWVFLAGGVYSPILILIMHKIQG